VEFGYLLHSRPWRESSLLLDLWLRDSGRCRALARGARRRGRGAAPGCRLFQPLEIALRGRGELKTAIALESGGAAHELRGRALYGGLYANELLVRTLPEGADSPELFAAYQALLDGLAAPEVELEGELRRFEMTLLQVLGYGLDFTHDARSGEPIREGASYELVPQCGFVEVAAAAGAVVDRLPGAALLRLGAGDLADGEQRRVAKWVMRRALGELIGDRPLHSRRLFLAAGHRS
jgi:DNA repair protein RecO (recombination protein O)